MEPTFRFSSFDSGTTRSGEEPLRNISIICNRLIRVLVAGALLAVLWGCEERPGPRIDLAVIRGGDVWVGSLSGGKAVRITRDGENRSPRLSPTGRRVAWTHGDGELWAAGTDGSKPRLLANYRDGIKALWAPDRDILAFAAGGELRVLKDGDAEPVRLVSAPPCDGCGVRDPVWSPDGRWIAYRYEERRATAQENEWPWETAIMKVSPEGGSPVLVHRFPVPQHSAEDDLYRPGNVHLARWIDRGILYWQCDEVSASMMSDGCPLYLLKPDGGKLELPGSLLYDDALALAPVPDAKTLVLGSGEGRETWAGKTVTLVDLESGAVRDISSTDSSSFSPVWAADGETLAFVSGPSAVWEQAELHENRAVLEGLAARRLWTVRRDGSAFGRLASDEEGREECPVRLPGGGGFLFLRMARPAEGSEMSAVSLWIADGKGGAARRVADSSGAPGISADWTGYYGHVDCGDLFDVSKGP